MTDIVERLRLEGQDLNNPEPCKYGSLMLDAAAEIERLRDALRSTVENLENMNIGSAQWVKAAFDVAAAARRTLDTTPSP